MSTAKKWNTLIKNALLFDGSGDYPVYRDVAVQDGNIVAIDKELSEEKAKKTVDASGRWLMPGLLDIHTHLDLEVEVNPGLGESVRHGTTTVVVGNCSLGTAFGRQQKDGANPVVDCFARVESIPKAVLAKCVKKITWDNTKDYLEHFAGIPLGPNIIPLIPHSMLRIEAMGFQAAVTRKANLFELETMKKLLAESMRQGYAGLSLDSLVFHYLANDPNKEKRIPTQTAHREEIFPLVEIVREYGRVMQTTPDNENIWNFLVRIFWSCGRLYKKSLKVSALVAIDFNPTPKMYKLMLNLAKLINSRFMRGKFHFQALPTNFRMWSNGLECPLFEELPSTREWLSCEVDDREAREVLVNDPAWVQRFRSDMYRVTPKTTLKEKIKQGRPPTFRLVAEEMKIDSVPHGLWNGESAADVLVRIKIFQESKGKDGAKNKEEENIFSSMPAKVFEGGGLVDFILFCLQEYDLAFRWYVDIANCRPDIVKKILFDENTLPGFNDSGAHITNMAFYDGNLCTLKIAQEESLQKVAIAVRRLTKDPAQFFGVDAGEVKVGAQADLVLINPEPLAQYDTNANRDFIHADHYDTKCMVNRSNGVVEEVYISGERVWEKGKRYTKALGRKTLGRFLSASKTDVMQKEDASQQVA